MLTIAKPTTQYNNKSANVCFWEDQRLTENKMSKGKMQPSQQSTSKVRTRSVSQQNMGNNVSSIHNQEPSSSVINPSSPQLTSPLPQIALETTMKVPKFPPLASLLYGESEMDNSTIQAAEETVPIRSIVPMRDFMQVSNEEKLNLIMVAINKFNTTFQHKLDYFTSALSDEEDGVFPRLRDCERDIDEFRDRMDTMETTNTGLLEDVRILKGIVKTQQNQLNALQHNAVEGKTRSMKNNLIIDGILQDDADHENSCKPMVHNFLKEQLGMEVAETEIVKAHRLGEKKTIRDRPIVVKVSEELKYKVFSNTKNLKGKKNDKNESFFVDAQLPEQVAASKRELTDKMARLKKYNAEQANQADKINFKMVKSQLLINNEVQRKKVIPPKVEDLLFLNEQEKEELKKCHLMEPNTVIEKGNLFLAYRKEVKSLEEVRRAYQKVRLMNPECDHIAMAYKVQNYDGSNDDGEWFAGERS